MRSGEAAHRSSSADLPIKLLQFVLCAVLHVLFLPVTLVGLAVAVHREFVVSKRLGVSFTAIKALQYRWFMHYFGTRTDPLSVAFIKAFPCESHFGLWATTGPQLLVHRLFGAASRLGRLNEPGEEGYSSCAGRRLLLFDDAIQRHIGEVEQIVIPGAGFDLLALQFTRDEATNVYEVDQPATLRAKTETLARAGLDHDWVTYVPVDYTTDSWVNELVAAGFDRTKKTLFLWQSVSLFLEEETARRTLEEMVGLCDDRCVVVQDLYSRDFVQGKTSWVVAKAANLAGTMGEPWRFGVDMSDDPETAVRTFLRSCGLEATAFTLFGEKREVQPYYCVVEAEKTARKAGGVGPDQASFASST